MLDIYEPPISTAWFQKQLDAATANYPGAVKLRIEWAPRLTEAKVIDKSGNTRVYRKYPLFGAETREYHVGNYFRRNGKIIAYQKTNETRGSTDSVVLIPPNVRATDLVVPHLERVNHSVHLFVIEKKLPDEYARQEWAKKRAMARAKIGTDIFGPFPSEGSWVWFDDISEHRLINASTTCCDIAEQTGLRCQGLYRAPNSFDLERVRAALQAHDRRPNLDDPAPLIAQAAKDRTEAIKDWEDNERLEILKEVRECNTLDGVAHGRTRVDLGSNPPIHRTAY